MKLKSISKKGLKQIVLVSFLFVIGLTAGCTSPTSSNSGNSVKFAQREAQTTLKMIYVREVAYHNEHGVYWGGPWIASAAKPHAFAELGITILPSARYTYSITAFSTTFTATATSSILDDDPSWDVWTINDNGTLLVIYDDSVN